MLNMYLNLFEKWKSLSHNTVRFYYSYCTITVVIVLHELYSPFWSRFVNQLTLFKRYRYIYIFFNSTEKEIVAGLWLFMGLHARHFIFHARVPIVPSWQQFRLSYCVPWFLLIPRWLQWSGQSSSAPDFRRSKLSFKSIIFE